MLELPDGPQSQPIIGATRLFHGCGLCGPVYVLAACCRLAVGLPRIRSAKTTQDDVRSTEHAELRIHRTYCVNMQRILQSIRGEGGGPDDEQSTMGSHSRPLLLPLAEENRDLICEQQTDKKDTECKLISPACTTAGAATAMQHVFCNSATRPCSPSSLCISGRGMYYEQLRRRRFRCTHPHTLPYLPFGLLS